MCAFVVFFNSSVDERNCIVENDYSERFVSDEIIVRKKECVFVTPGVTDDKHSVCVLCSRVSCVPVESRVWELCVELDKNVHMLGVSRSGNNYMVSESV